MPSAYGFPFTERASWKFEGSTVTAASSSMLSLSLDETHGSEIARLKVVPEKVSVSCNYQNDHHKCCWARTVLDSQIADAHRSNILTNRRETKRICENIWKTIKDVKKKPILRRTITFDNCLPPVFRYAADGTNVYTLTGKLSLKIENVPPTVDPIQFVPDFLVVRPSQSCMQYLFHDPCMVCSKCKIDKGFRSNPSQLLLCQGLTSNEKGLFATYTPFSWVISGSGSPQSFAVREGMRRPTRKRNRHLEGSESVPLQITIQLSVDGVSLPYSDTKLMNDLMTLYDYQPSITKERRFGKEGQKMGPGNREGNISRRAEAILKYLHEKILSDDKTSSDERIGTTTRPVIQFLGMLKSSNSILVEPCENSSSNQLAAIFPNSFIFPFRLYLGGKGTPPTASFTSTSTLRDVLELF